MQGTLVSQPLLSPQVSIPTVLFSASLAVQLPFRLIQLSVQGSEPRLVLSFIPYAVGSTFMPCYQHFSRPAQPIGPATRLSGSVSTCKARIFLPCHLSCGYVKPIPTVGLNRALYLLVWQVTSGVTLAAYGAIYPIIGTEQ